MDRAGDPDIDEHPFIVWVWARTQVSMFCFAAIAYSLMYLSPIGPIAGEDGERGLESQGGNRLRRSP